MAGVDAYRNLNGTIASRELRFLSSRLTARVDASRTLEESLELMYVRISFVCMSLRAALYVRALTVQLLR